MRIGLFPLLTLALSASLAGAEPSPERSRIFVIRVIDGETQRGVPLAELTTTAGERWITDSQGVIAIASPLLFGKEIFFHVRSHGYAFPKDGFGMEGRKLHVTAGDQTILKLRRTQVAERLYRITGAGIYHHSSKAQLEVPIRHPLLNAGVSGCDSVQSIVYNNKLHWFWGDTNRLEDPLGNFHTTGAISALPALPAHQHAVLPALDPGLGIDLDYFADGKGFVRPVARMKGEGPTWLSGLAVLPDRDGRARMVASYVKVRNFLEVYERGLMAWNDEKAEFEHLSRLPLDLPAFPEGHSFSHTVMGDDGKKQTMIYFGDPYPFLRIPNSFEAWQDPSTYEVYAAGEESGSEVRWRKDGRTHRPWSIKMQRLRDKKSQSPSSSPVIQLRDARTRAEVVAHRGTVRWNKFRKKWIMIATEAGGTSSYLGEVWYAEAEEPEGPWRSAVKIVTHDQYSFYNPRHHPYFDSADGRYIYFEGTYTTLFSKTPERHKTPLYDYNQIMYRLDLAHPALRPAQSREEE